MLIVMLAIVAAAGATGGLAAFALTGSAWVVLVAYSGAGVASAAALLLIAARSGEPAEPRFDEKAADADFAAAVSDAQAQPKPALRRAA